MLVQAIYTQLHTRATATQTDRNAPLPGGARLAVGLRKNCIVVTISQKGTRLSDAAIIRYQTTCGVPASAERIPRAGQRRIRYADAIWYSVSWRLSSAPTTHTTNAPHSAQKG